MKSALPVLFAIICAGLPDVSAQSPLLNKPEKAKAIIDTRIAAMIDAVNADSIKAYISRLAAFGTRHSLSDTVSQTRGIGAARRWVARKFASFSPRLVVKMDAFTIKGGINARIPSNIEMKNVIAILPGREAADNRVLLVSGHLDSRNSDVMDARGDAPGANDDASGIALVLELARVISAADLPCTLMFVAVQGEEQGLLGAAHLADSLRKNRVNVLAMLNNDIVGNSTAGETGERNDRTVRIFSEMIPSAETEDEKKLRLMMFHENDSPSRQLARYIKDVSEVYLGGFSATLNARPDRFLRGGDHTPFNRAGIPAVRFTEFHEDYTRQHQNVRTEKGVRYGDLTEFVDHSYTANITRMNLAALVTLAKAPGMPRKATMNIELGNVTTLSWQAPESGPTPKGYFVLVRETHNPLWEKKYFTSDHSASLPFSKDNYFFGVQSVGTDGHVGQIVVPVPLRD